MLKCVHQKIKRAAWVLGLLAGWAGLCGCQSRPVLSNTPPVLIPDASAAAPAAPAAPATPAAPAAPATDNSPSMVLREGDTVRITFPGAPSLDTAQTIRRDGKITLDMVGEMKAAGLTPHDLEQQLLKAYYDQLVVKEVTVTVQTSVFVVYVTGAVLRPGKLVSDRVETPLEAVIEAGIDPAKSNLKKIVIIRENENGKTEHFSLNLDDVMKGKATVPFTLKSMDKIYVPEKFSWF
jgi:protein involved in polysaccharide export with SLBB domain